MSLSPAQVFRNGMHFPLLLTYPHGQGHIQLLQGILSRAVYSPTLPPIFLYFHKSMCRQSSRPLIPPHTKTMYCIFRYNAKDFLSKQVHAADKSSEYPNSVPPSARSAPAFRIFRQYRYSSDVPHRPNLPPHQVRRIFQMHLLKTTLFHKNHKSASLPANAPSGQTEIAVHAFQVSMYLHFLLPAFSHLNPYHGRNSQSS